MARYKTLEGPKKGEIPVIKRGKKTDNPGAAGTKGYAWWNAKTQKQTAEELISTAVFLKNEQSYRNRQGGIYARLYGNQPLTTLFGPITPRISPAMSLPINRPTMNVIQSVIDTKVARITQNRPRPVYQGNDADAKERKIAKQLNMFINGEFYQTKAYQVGKEVLRDSQVLGTGAVKIVESIDHRVALERRLNLELLVDYNESVYGRPLQLYEFKLMDRSVLAAYYPKYSNDVGRATSAIPEQTSDRSVADLVMVVEGWRLPSGKDTGDGRHSIAISSGLIFDEEWTKPRFPYVFLHDSTRLWGFWAQGVCERLIGTQSHLSSTLLQISKSAELAGVPRVFVDDGSKVAKAAWNNNIGSIITYSGTMPQLVPGTAGVDQTLVDLSNRDIQYMYQSEGVSQMTAGGETPLGPDASGEAIRSYDNLSTDRMATLAKAYSNFYEDLAYGIIDLAIDICEREGSYESVYPDKHGTHRVDLPNVKEIANPYVIQCSDMSSLPNDPAGRRATVADWAKAGWITGLEARRLLDFPDLEHSNKLAFAQQDRILCILDDIVEHGTQPTVDPFLLGPDPSLPTQLITQYYNRYAEAKLPESKLKMLRDFNSQILALKQQSMPAPPPGIAPAAVPQAPPVSGLLPNVPQS